MVIWWWRRSSQLRMRTNGRMPHMAPLTRGRMARKSRSRTASMANSYWPRTSRMKEPEMPGRIMAVIAAAPLRKSVIQSWGISMGTSPTSHQAAPAPDRTLNAAVTDQRSRAPTVTMLARTSPRKKANSGSGWWSSSQPTGAGQDQDGGGDAGAEHRQEAPGNGGDRLAEAQAHQHEQQPPVERLEGVHEFLVDAHDERHGAAGDAGDDVGGAHGQAGEGDVEIVLQPAGRAAGCGHAAATVPAPPASRSTRPSTRPSPPPCVRWPGRRCPRLQGWTSP